MNQEQMWHELIALPPHLQQEVFDFISIFKLNEAISDKAAALLRQYRLSHGLLIADALIAATTITWNTPLASKNQRDYRFIAELKLMPYP